MCWWNYIAPVESNFAINFDIPETHLRLPYLQKIFSVLQNFKILISLLLKHDAITKLTENQKHVPNFIGSLFLKFQDTISSCHLKNIMVLFLEKLILDKYMPRSED